MKLKVGDKVIVNPPDWYSGSIKVNEKCVVTSIGYMSEIIWVQNTNGIKAMVYRRWASKITKNQQLEFEFMR